MQFNELISHPKILLAIQEMGYVEPTDIQQKAIPKILEGSDIFASAETGTGKTAAFMLPSLQKILSAPIPPKGSNNRGPLVLVLVPTRELAMQVAAEAIKYSKHLPHIKTVCIFGGASYSNQHKDLSRPYHILVATPGRLMDHMQQGRILLSRIETLILDEADRMLDMGFIDAVEMIVKATPKSRQTLLFSATMEKKVLYLSNKILTNPVEIAIESTSFKQENIIQTLHYVDGLEHKYQLLDHHLKDPNITQAIVFTSTKHQADALADKLYELGHQAAALHGDMSQRERTRTMMELRKERIRVLVATDVASRGIDVLTISHVINFDLPACAGDYVHRIGRTGRAGACGTALSFVSFKDKHLLKRIEIFTGQKITTQVIPGLEPKKRSENKRSSDKRPFSNNKSKRKVWKRF
ncbi:MAG: DEAD/DEAH box helicase [Chlamydiota bacterium]